MMKHEHIVKCVEPGSIAEEMGIEAGDILLSLNGQRITSQSELDSLVYSMRIGDTVEAVIYRGGNQYRIQLTLTEAKG